MPNQYYGIAVQSMTSSLGTVGHSDAFSGQAVSYIKQRVAIVFQSATVFVGTGTQIGYIANFTTAGIAAVAQLI